MIKLYKYNLSFSNIKLFLFGTALSFLAIILNILFQLILKTASVTSYYKGELIDHLHPLLSSLATGFLEEFLFRVLLLGFLLKQLKNHWVAILISSLIFSILHFGNSHITLLALISHFFGGLVYSYAYYKTRSIWLPFGLHFGWNYTQILLGIPMSGSTFYSLFSTSFYSEELLSGGLYGFEGGLLSLFLRLLLLIGIFYWMPIEQNTR